MVKAPILAKMAKMLHNETSAFFIAHENSKKNAKKVWWFQKSAYLCSPFRKKDFLNGFSSLKILEEQVQQVPRTINRSRASILRIEIEKASGIKLVI